MLARSPRVAIFVALMVLAAPLGSIAVADIEPLADELVRFEDVTREAGFPIELKHPRVAWGDYDGDGWEDLLLDGRSLWRNLGNGRFTDVTNEAGIRGVPSVGGVWADYDNDGDADFYAIVRSHTKRDALWRNDGDGTFTDVTVQAGNVYDLDPSEGAAWGDYDGDSLVDLYVANYETASVDNTQELGIGTVDVLWHNMGDGTFENVSEDAGVWLDDDLTCGRGVAWCDYDDDGDYDIYVSNYRLDPNLLWRNDGDGSFTNVARQARVEGYAEDSVPGGPRYGHTIGSDWGDYDNDGDMDLYASNLAHPRFIMFSDKSMLLNNRGDGSFIDRYYGSGIDYCETSSDPAWADYDNDGDLDLYFTAVYEDTYSRMFRNGDRDRFEDATAETRTSVNNGWGIGWCDYDHDGDLDMAVGSDSGFRLLRNGGNENNWLQVELEGTWVNKLAIGARVRVSAGDLELVRDVKGGKGTTSQDMFAVHFGLGGHTGTVDVDVRWPGDTAWTPSGTFTLNQRVHIVQGDVNIDASIALEATPDEPRMGDAVDLAAIVVNEGETTIESVELTFTVQGVGQVGPEYTVGPLDPGGTETARTIWQPIHEGVFTVIAQIGRVQPFDAMPENDVSRVVVTVRVSNLEPIARMIVEPTTVPPGEVVTFDGTASSDDSEVDMYMFEYGDGTDSGWQVSPRSEHTYTMEGELLASLTVKDVDGMSSSNFATALVTVTSRGFRPTAEVITVAPNPAREGDVVTLHGKGFPVGNATIEGHSWNSSIEGHLGDVSLITVATLQPGEHNIIYKVLDSRGLWSDPVTIELVINPPEGKWNVQVDEPREGANADGDILHIEGTTDYTGGRVMVVEVRIDNRDWEVAMGTDEWSRDVDISSLVEGVHTLRVRAASSDSNSGLVFVNFTIGAPDGDTFDLRAWLLSIQGIFFIVVVAVLANAIVIVARGRRASRARARARARARGKARPRGG